MGFYGSTCNIMTFAITDNSSIPPPAEILQGLKRLAFVPILDSTEERSVGWVNFFQRQLTTFDEPTDATIGDYVFLALRQEQRKVPGAVMREVFDAACKKFLTENPGYRRVPKQKREEIKESVRQQLLLKTLPVPTIYDAVWNTKTGKLFLFTTSKAAVDLFESAFKRTFPEVHAKWQVPYLTAVDVLAESDLPGTLLALHAANRASTEALLDLLKSNAWIGTDFLKWLLYVQGTDGMFTRPELSSWIDKKLVICNEDPQKITMAGTQAKIPEAAMAALRDGGQVAEATIFFSDTDDNEWRLTLKAESFDIASMRCPKVQIERDGDEIAEHQAVALEKIYLLEKGIGHLRYLLQCFLQERMANSWGETLTRIEAWLSGGA